MKAAESVDSTDEKFAERRRAHVEERLRIQHAHRQIAVVMASFAPEASKFELEEASAFDCSNEPMFGFHIRRGNLKFEQTCAGGPVSDTGAEPEACCCVHAVARAQLGELLINPCVNECVGVTPLLAIAISGTRVCCTRVTNH